MWIRVGNRGFPRRFTLLCLLLTLGLPSRQAVRADCHVIAHLVPAGVLVEPAPTNPSLLPTGYSSLYEYPERGLLLEVADNGEFYAYRDLHSAGTAATRIRIERERPMPNSLRADRLTVHYEVSGRQLRVEKTAPVLDGVLPEPPGISPGASGLDRELREGGFEESPPGSGIYKVAFGAETVMALVAGGKITRVLATEAERFPRNFASLVASRRASLARDRRFSYPRRAKKLFQTQWRDDFLRSGTDVRLHGRDGTEASLLGGISPRYLENQAEAAMYFYDWFLGRSNISFDEMTRGAHFRAAVGSSGRKRYLKKEGRLVFGSDELHPGVYRIDVAEEERGALHFGGDSFRLTNEDRAALARAGMPIEADDELHSRLPTIPQKLSMDPWVSRAPGTEADLTMVRFVPSNLATFLAYRRETELAMSDLIGFLDESPSAIRAKPERFIAALARYHQAGLHWMPFEGINNSIFMGQVNVMLRHFGFAPLPHERLDYLAITAPSDVYAKAFQEAFEKRNPR